MAEKPRAKNIAKKRRKVEKKRRKSTAKKRRKLPRGKKSRRRVTSHTPKKKPRKKPQRRKIQRRKPKIRPTPPKRKKVKRKFQAPIIPPNWKKVVIRHSLDVERMAAQVAQRIHEKVISQGYDAESYEAQILLSLIEAEQTGTFNQALYDLAGEYPDYDTPQEIYTLWLYSGN